MSIKLQRITLRRLLLPLPVVAGIKMWCVKASSPLRYISTSRTFDPLRTFPRYTGFLGGTERNARSFSVANRIEEKNAGIILGIFTSAPSRSTFAIGFTEAHT